MPDGFWALDLTRKYKTEPMLIATKSHATFVAPAVAGVAKVPELTKKLAMKSPTKDVSIGLWVRRKTIMRMIPHAMSTKKDPKMLSRGYVKKLNRPPKVVGSQLANSTQLGVDHATSSGARLLALIIAKSTTTPTSATGM